ncbi:hypothetical protein [Caballeronia concitans]|uniref:Uncharacterized protein n=1 Tax=Caballeronia concitans TaxID=1777133 RepID=A0A658R4B7_9BURK|nr:hypothetical protein [Caballeronia concitans]SAL49289.1 hypothetical protein AWB72_05151 [Caballeronia concitans]
MNDKKPFEITPSASLHDAAKSIGLTVATLRKAQGKPNPNDFPVGTPEFEKYESEFLDDVLAFMGDPD